MRSPLPSNRRRVGTLFALATLLGTSALSSCDCGEELSAVPAPIAELAYGEASTPPDDVLQVAIGAVLVGQGGAEFALQLNNTGNATLAVSDIRLSADTTLCPAVSSAFSITGPLDAGDGTRSTTVAAGASQPIAVRFAPTNGTPACAVLEVASNDAEHPTLRALLTGQGDAAELCADTAVVDFGEVHVNDTASDTVVLRSCGTRPVTLSSITASGPLPPFSMDDAGLAGTYAPGEEIRVPVGFAPTAPGNWTQASGNAGLLTFNVDAPGALYQVALVGTSREPPRCHVRVNPSVMQFGTVAESRTSTLPLIVQNLGELDCQIDNMEVVSGASFSADLTGFTPGQQLSQGQSVAINVTFAPSSAGGTENGVLRVSSNDPVAPSIDVPLEGNSIALPDCLIEAQPTALNFGFQATRQHALLDLTLANVGTEDCLVTGAEITVGFPTFKAHVPGFPDLDIPFLDDLTGARVRPGESTAVQIVFKPPLEQEYTGNVAVEFREAGFAFPLPSSQTLNVPLRGEGLGPQICVSPGSVDFGAVSVGQTAAENVTVTNCGSIGLSLRGVQLRGGSHADFSISQRPAVPSGLMPGESLTVQVTAAPGSAGPMYGVLELLSTDGDQPSFPVPLEANAGTCSGLFCNPDPVNFGAAPIGSEIVRAVTCYNPTPSAIAITPSTVAPFEVVNAPAQIGPQQTGVITVRYNAIVGNDVGTLNLGAPSCDAPNYSIGLQGSGDNTLLPACPTPETFSPTPVWEFPEATQAMGGFAVPGSTMVWTTPLISRLEDTNADGIITAADVPRIVTITFDHRDSPSGVQGGEVNIDHINDPTPGVLRALDGQTGAEIWTNTEHRVHSAVTPALADIDADGFVEIIAQKYVLLEGIEDAVGAKIRGKFARGNLLAFEHDGTLKWESEEWTRSIEEIEDSGAVTVGDMDGDGFAEIAVGDQVFDHNGYLKWAGGKGTGSTGHGPISVMVDVDGQPGLELVAGTTVYRANGTILWDRSDDIYDAHPAVADLNNDGVNEVVIRGKEVYVLNGQTGATIAGPRHPPTRPEMGLDCESPMNNGGGDDNEDDPCSIIPTHVAIMDLDGDGDLEIGVGANELFLAYDHNLNELWRTSIFDGSGASGPNAFDFEGNGSQEVVYNDEGHIYAYNAAGQTIYEASRSSVTLAETTSVGDVTLDGHANLVTGSNEPRLGFAEGLDVWSNTGISWAQARGMWNQHAYVEPLVGEFGALATPGANAPALHGFRTASAMCVP